MIKQLLSKHFDKKVFLYKRIFKIYDFINFILFMICYFALFFISAFLSVFSIIFEFHYLFSLPLIALFFLTSIFVIYKMKKCIDENTYPHILKFILKFSKSKFSKRIDKAIFYSNFNLNHDKFKDIIKEIQTMDLKSLNKNKKFIVNNIDIFNNKEQQTIIDEINKSIDFFENQEKRILNKYKENIEKNISIKEKFYINDFNYNKILKESNEVVFYNLKFIIKESKKLSNEEKRNLFFNIEERIDLYIEKNKILEKENKYVKSKIIKSI